LQCDAGWLFVIHEVEHSSVRRYRHRFVRLRTDGGLDASAPFSFTGHRIEFAAGLAPHGSQVLISFGVGDRVAAIARVALTEVLDLLQPVGRTPEKLVL
jgi:predicted GH43/DUF377 family glycosyl hydrolase